MSDDPLTDNERLAAIRHHSLNPPLTAIDSRWPRTIEEYREALGGIVASEPTKPPAGTLDHFLGDAP